jgi:hypothetical protein
MENEEFLCFEELEVWRILELGGNLKKNSFNRKICTVFFCHQEPRSFAAGSELY